MIKICIKHNGNVIYERQDENDNKLNAKEQKFLESIREDDDCEYEYSIRCTTANNDDLDDFVKKVKQSCNNRIRDAILPAWDTSSLVTDACSYNASALRDLFLESFFSDCDNCKGCDTPKSDVSHQSRANLDILREYNKHNGDD